jgi:hypothetical protein
VGDVLASSRFYRRSRPIVFEDDFGKYFQKIVVKLRQDQLAANFPNLVKSPGGKPVVTISGSLSIELKTKDDFLTFLRFAKDIDNLLQQPAKPIFNSSTGRGRFEIIGHNINRTTSSASGIESCGGATLSNHATRTRLASVIVVGCCVRSIQIEIRICLNDDDSTRVTVA